MFEGATASLAGFTTSVFEYDFNKGTPIVVDKSKYSAAEMKIISDTATIPVVIPKPADIKGAYVTPKPAPIAIASSDEFIVYTSPDYARTQLFQVPSIHPFASSVWSQACVARRTSATHPRPWTSCCTK